ncbi:hypothetical protein ACJX0J_020427, partial [Zea mays]
YGRLPTNLGALALHIFRTILKCKREATELRVNIDTAKAWAKRKDDIAHVILYLRAITHVNIFAYLRLFAIFSLH